MTLFDLCILVPDDYNQIEEKDEKKNFVNSLWADSANNPVMSSKLICVFQTENQQTKSEVRIYRLFFARTLVQGSWNNFERLGFS